VRGGSFKVHYVTLSLYAWDPIFHDPPLIYNVEIDPSEIYPLNASNYTSLLADFAVAVKKHNSTMEFGEDQMRKGSDPSVAVCCNRATDCVCGQTE